MSAPPATTPASPELTKRFAVFLKGVIDAAGFPEGAEGDAMRRQVAGRLTREFEQPRTRALEFVLQEKFTADKARHLMFFPEPSPAMVGRYALLVCDAPDGAPRDHPQRKPATTIPRS